MKSEHDDDMTAEVHEGAAGEADEFPAVVEDDEERTTDTDADDLRAIRRNLEDAAEGELEGD